MKYIAKPKLFNSIGKREFDNPVEAIKYLNEYLAPKDGDSEDYVFMPVSTSERFLKKSIQEFVDIGKLQVVVE